jgi:hypothetical protein
MIEWPTAASDSASPHAKLPYGVRVYALMHASIHIPVVDCSQAT